MDLRPQEGQSRLVVVTWRTMHGCSQKRHQQTAKDNIESCHFPVPLWLARSRLECYSQACMHPLHFRKCLGRTTLGCRITDLLFAETNPCASHCRTAHRSTYFLQRTVRSSLFPDRIDPPNRAFNAALTRGVWADMVIRVGERACMAVACTLQVWPQVGGHLWLRSRALMLSHQPRSQALPAWGQPADQSCGCHTVHLTFQRSTRHQLQCRVITRRSCRRTHTPYRSNRPSKAPRQVLCISRGHKRPYP